MQLARQDELYNCARTCLIYYSKQFPFFSLLFTNKKLERKRRYSFSIPIFFFYNKGNHNLRINFS